MKLLFIAIICLGINSLQAKETLKKAEWITDIDQAINNLGVAKRCFTDVTSNEDYKKCMDLSRKMTISFKKSKLYREMGVYIKQLKKNKN